MARERGGATACVDAVVGDRGSRGSGCGGERGIRLAVGRGGECVCIAAGCVLACSGCSWYRAFREWLNWDVCRGCVVGVWCVLLLQLLALKERTADVVQDVISKAAADQQATAARLSKEHQAAMQRCVWVV